MLLDDISNDTGVINRGWSEIHFEMRLFGCRMHSNRAEVEDIFEKSFCLSINLFHILESTFGDSSVEKRYLFYSAYALVGYYKEIEFVIYPIDIEKQERYGRVQYDKQRKNITRDEREQRIASRKKEGGSNDKEQCI